MIEAKNFSCYKRLISKQLLQVSGLCGTLFLSYLPKRSTQIYRAQYADAILVSLRGTTTWRPEINENIWNSLLLQERLFFPHERVYIHINTSPDTWTVQTAKKLLEKTFFQTRQLCHAGILMSRTGRQFRNSRCCILNTKDNTELKTCEKINF